MKNWMLTALAGLILVLINEIKGYCKPSCIRENKTCIIQCPNTGFLPILPTETQEVYIKDFQFTTSQGENLFSHDSWKNISKLDITVLTPNTNDHISGDFFTGLTQLQSLGLHGINSLMNTSQKTVKRFTFSKGSFAGLDNLKCLDFSGNPALRIAELLPALKNKATLPKLEILDISQLKTMRNEPYVKPDLTDITDVEIFVKECLSQRSIKQLYMNGLELIPYIRPFKTLCSTLEILTLQKSNIGAIGYFECRSLNMLDLTNSNIPSLQTLMKRLPTSSDFLKYFNENFSVLFSVQTLIIDNILPEHQEPMTFANGIIFECTGLTFRTKFLSFRHNHLQNLNVSFRNLPFPQGSEIDVSFNNIEYIHPKCVDPGNSIVKINLSHNRLHKMEEHFYDEFKIFLYNYKNLEELDLSCNKIVVITFDMFCKNEKLRKLNLASNHLKVLDINVIDLTTVNYLDIRSNRLSNLDYATMQNIQSLGSNKSEENDTFAVYLGSNEYKCNCDEFSFETWVKQSTFLKGNAYFCYLNEARFDMKASAIDEVKRKCRQLLIQRTLIVLSCSALFFIVVFTVVFYLLRRQRIIKNKVNELMKKLKQAGVNERFLVFLAYCSEDAELVSGHIYRQLNEEISKRVERAGTYVCMDEKDFRPGFPIATEIMSNLERSYVMVCVASQQFATKTWCQIEVEEAYSLHKPIILLVKDHIDQSVVPTTIARLFQRNTIAKITVEQDGTCQIRPPLEVLCTAIFELAVTSNVQST